MKAARILSRGARIAARSDGDAGKPWLVLLNSLGADWTMWDDQIPLLTQTHRVLRIDTRGHGQSDGPAGPYDFPMLVADVVAVMDHFAVDRADVMGLSLGGMTALGLVLTHPDRVGRMIVCDARADNPPPFVASWDDRIAAINRTGMAAVRDGTLERWFTPDCLQSVRDRASDMILATSKAGYIGCAEALKTLDYLKDLDRIDVPVLYLVGENDMGAPAAAMKDMAAATRVSDFVVIPGMAHIPNMEAPDAFNAAIAPWLREAASVALSGAEA